LPLVVGPLDARHLDRADKLSGGIEDFDVHVGRRRGDNRFPIAIKALMGEPLWSVSVIAAAAPIASSNLMSIPLTPVVPPGSPFVN
jgi:hypothetical protein